VVKDNVTLLFVIIDRSHPMLDCLTAQTIPRPMLVCSCSAHVPLLTQWSLFMSSAVRTPIKWTSVARHISPLLEKLAPHPLVVAWFRSASPLHDWSLRKRSHYRW
jgi:hypothetical protein